MKSVYVFAENAAFLAEMVSAGRSYGENCYALACGGSASDYANVGADKVYYLGDGMPESYAKEIANLLRDKGAELFIADMTTTGREVAGRVAGYLDCPMVGDAQKVTVDGDTVTTERMIYGGAIIVTEKFSGLGVITFGTGKFPPAEGASPVEECGVQADDRVKFESSNEIVREGVDITAAEKVVGAGMGFTTREELQLAYDLAKAIGAEVGCTRALAEDNHWFSEYIGLSGIQISPKLYFALGISGQVQHSVGVRGSKVLIAINRDEKCPIMSNCDYGVVGDMYELVPMLIKELNG